VTRTSSLGRVAGALVADQQPGPFRESLEGFSGRLARWVARLHQTESMVLAESQRGFPTKAPESLRALYEEWCQPDAAMIASSWLRKVSSIVRHEQYLFVPHGKK
jgi:hypothetical protein